MTKEEIGKILKQLRLNCGKTQKEVAEHLGKSQQLIGHWETGYSQPDANTLFVLCNFYGTTVDKAFGFVDDNGINAHELSLIKKYRLLDTHGKELISILLEKELQRCAASTSPAAPTSKDQAKNKGPDVDAALEEIKSRTAGKKAI